MPRISEEARARMNARHAERARARSRALVEDSLWLLEVGGCSLAEIVARTGYGKVDSYEAAMRRGGRLDVLYRVKRDREGLARWQAERAEERRQDYRRWRRAYEERNRQRRREANRERMRRVRAAVRAAAAAAEWERRKMTDPAGLLEALRAERVDLVSVGAEAQDAQEGRRMRWTVAARAALGELCGLLDRELTEAGERDRSVSRQEAS